jgi:uncharacterized RDD family membrane protein YckC
MAVEYKIIGGDGREYGPATLEEIRQWCADGRVAPGTPVWRGDERRWQPAGLWDELKWDLPRAAAPVAPPPVVEVLRPAGFWVRFAAYLFDSLVIGCLLTLITYPWAAELAKLQNDALTQLQAYSQHRSESLDMAVMFRFWLATATINLPVSFIYFVGFNTLRGATPGKHIFGLRVLGADGSRLTLGRAALRQVAEWLSALTFGAGFLLVALTPQKRALHDLLARTQVVFQRRPGGF